MTKRYISKRLLRSAKDQPCVLCQHIDGKIVTDTTVPAHLPGSFYGMPSGTSQRTHDWLVAHLCHEHHEKMDTIWRKDAQMRMMALCLTLERLFGTGEINTIG